MIDTTQLDIRLLNTLDTDFKAEVIAYNLWKYHQDIDLVFLKRLGSNNRSFLKDIKGIKEEFFDLDSKIFSIQTYKEGLYDYLPEGLFHPPSFNKSLNGVSSVVEQIQKQKKIENNARNFFQPFEQEFFFNQISSLIIEDSFDTTSNDSIYIEIIEELWPLLNDLNKSDARVFAHLLPYLYSARGKKDWMEKCLSSFLKVNVKVGFIPNEIGELDEASSKLVLSNMTLGITSVLTGKHFDGERNWHITYGPIEYEKLDQYMPTSSLRNLLKSIYTYCIPNTVNVQESFISSKNENSFKLEQKNCSLLGYSTYL